MKKAAIGMPAPALPAGETRDELPDRRAARNPRVSPGRASAIANTACVGPSLAETARPQPINLEEPIDRIVGRRTKPLNVLASAASTKAGAIAWRAALGGVRVPRGVYRFKTHEEADQWLWRMIARPTS